MLREVKEEIFASFIIGTSKKEVILTYIQTTIWFDLLTYKDGTNVWGKILFRCEMSRTTLVEIGNNDSFIWLDRRKAYATDAWLGFLLKDKM